MSETEPTFILLSLEQLDDLQANQLKLEVENSALKKANKILSDAIIEHLRRRELTGFSLLPGDIRLVEYKTNEAE